MLTFHHATRASQGARPYQEDAAAVWPGRSPLVPRDRLPPGIDLVVALADGMGGHAAGDVASNLICGLFLQSLGASGAIADRLVHGLSAANEGIRRKTEANPSMAGMGATLIGLVLSGGGKAEWVSVGDSLLYLWRGGELVRLNQDHSLAPLLDQMVADGKMTAEDAEADPRRHYLRSAVTGEELDLIDLSEDPLLLEGSDILVIASDGILSIEEDDIRRLVSAYAGEGAEIIADALLRAVDRAGVPHQDNTTIVVVKAMPSSAVAQGEGDSGGAKS